MRVAVVTLFPTMIDEFIRHGVLSRSVASGLLEVTTYNPRDYTVDAHRTVDDRPYGGGPGMVMKIEPMQAAIEAARDNLSEPALSEPVLGDEAQEETSATPLVVFLSPQGARFDQQMARDWASDGRPLMLIAGRYEGVDQRLLDTAVDKEVSLGDFVLSGGEVGVMAILDAVSRLIPGSLGNQGSALSDSFGEDGLLEYPQYTRPEVHQGQCVPEVLKGGDHGLIAQWRRQQSLLNTWRKRPDLLQAATEKGELNKQDLEFLKSLQDTTDNENSQDDGQ